MVVLVGRLLARLLRWFRQPTVVAEVVAGIILGPSLLGILWPEAMDWLFPTSTMPALGLISQFGLVFFMFLVGLEFDPSLLRERGHHPVVISHASILVPFLLGGLLAWPLHATLAPEGVPLASFTLFLGAAMSITAFPVLARILAERGMLRTPVGAIALSCAAVDDVTAWCILAFVVSFARAEGLRSALVTTVFALAFVAVILGVVRPLLRRLGPRQGHAISADTVAIAFLLLFVSATITELIGIHALFGGFLLGAVMPRSGGLTHAIAEKVEDLVTIVLLPLFFAYSGLRTQIGLLDDPGDWLICAVIMLVACAGKFGGSTLAARFVGLGWREASAIGILMNTRGLMELIVLNVGLDLGILSEELFTMMVLMALVTTWVTSPLLERFYPRRQMFAAPPAEPAAAPPTHGPTILGLSDPALVPALLAVCRHLVEPEEALLALHVMRSDRPSAYLAAPAEPEPLDVLKARADEMGVAVRLLSFVAADPAADIVRFAEAKAARLIVLGGHRPVVGEGAIAGVVGRVIAESTVDVAVLIDQGLTEARGVYVMGDDAVVSAVAERLIAGGLIRGDAPGPGVIVVAALGSSIPVGVSALLVRPGRT